MEVPGKSQASSPRAGQCRRTCCKGKVMLSDDWLWLKKELRALPVAAHNRGVRFEPSFLFL
jgi:hypothetical protein